MAGVRAMWARSRAVLGTRLAAFCWLLVGLLVAYALIIVAGGRLLGSVARIMALACVLAAALRIHRLNRDRTMAVARIAVVAVSVTAVAAAFAGGVLLQILTACSVMVIVTLTGVLVVRYLVISARVDLATVLGVLCIYLLIALFFSSIHEIGAAIQSGYLVGVLEPPTSGDCLYLSVITITTVGFGDVTPGTDAARMVAVIEALIGQFYLVSVVAAVISGWRPGAHRGPEGPAEGDEQPAEEDEQPAEGDEQPAEGDERPPEVQ